MRGNRPSAEPHRDRLWEQERVRNALARARELAGSGRHEGFASIAIALRVQCPVNPYRAFAAAVRAELEQQCAGARARRVLAKSGAPRHLLAE